MEYYLSFSLFLQQFSTNSVNNYIGVKKKCKPTTDQFSVDNNTLYVVINIYLLHSIYISLYHCQLQNQI